MTTTEPIGGRSLDLSPAPGPAPAGLRIRRHAMVETKLLVRNGEQLLIALVIPLGILIVGHALGGRFGDLRTLAPSVLGVALWSSAFTSIAIATGFERRYGVLERLATTPLGRTGLLTGKALAVTIIVLGQLAILSVAALLLGWRPSFTAASAAFAVLVVVLASATFVLLGLLLAGRLRAEVTLALANLIFVVLLAAGGLVVPVTSYLPAVQPIVALLPTAALGTGLRAAAVGTVAVAPVLILSGWLMLAALGVRKGFRWTS